VSNLKGTIRGNSLTLNWKSYNSQEKLKVYISTENGFKNGINDHYRLVKKVSSCSNGTTINLKKYTSKFYKIVVEGKYNSANTWIILK
jgi:hypothetical protein